MDSSIGVAIYPESGADCETLLNKADSSSITFEEKLDLPGGERIWLTTLTPVLDEGIVSHIVGSATDITEQKNLELYSCHQYIFDNFFQLNFLFLDQAILGAFDSFLP